MKTIRYLIICIIAILFSLPLHAQNKVQCNQGDQDSTRNNGNETIDSSSLDHKEIKEEASQDPNEIVGIDGWLFVANGDTLRWVSATQQLPYTIYFENDPEQATAAAQVVTIRMRLDPLMNMADFGIGTFGFGNHIFPVEGAPLQYQTRLDLTAEMNLYVDVVAGIDITTNEAFWIFSSIDPATGVAPTETDRGFLAVNDSTHIGEGYVTFSIKPKTDLCHTGDTISAQASIVFDINDPIETNRWVNTIDAVPPVSSCTVIDDTLLRPSDTSPNLGEEPDSIRIIFSGMDDTTGIAAYRLYYTEGRSAFRLAGRYLPDDTAVLEKSPNVQYTFFSIAEDNVGNMEPMKDSPDTLFGNTRVSLLASVTPAGAAVIEGTGAYTQGDTAQLVLHPATGYRLSRWTEAGVPQGTDTILALVADRSHTLVAEMALQQYPLTVEAATGTTIEVTSHSQGAMTNSLSPVTYSDTLSIHLSSSPCYSDVAFFLNGQPISDDTTIIVHDSVHLTSTATAHIDTGYVHDTVCPGTAYTANGFNILSSSTNTPGILNFQFSIFNLNGCDSIAILNLVVRPFHTLTFLPNGGTGTMPAQHVCSGEATVLNGSTYTREGYFFAGWATTANATTAAYTDGDIITLTDDQTLYAVWSSDCVNRESNRMVTLCDSFLWNNQWLTSSGQYERTVSSVVPGGCDSIYRLHLTVKQSTENLRQITTCNPYTWIDGETYATDTIRQLSMTNSVGCDSIATLALTITDAFYVTETVNACDSFTWHDRTLTATMNHIDTLTSVMGCDSVVTLNLTVNHSSAGDTFAVACDSFYWRGVTYFADMHEASPYTTINSVGCDSLVTLHLTVNYSNTGVEEVTACNSYVWHGVEYNASTDTATFITTNFAGCDSVTTLNLTINHCSTTNIVACDSYTWHGIDYTMSGVYIDGNDTLSLVINHSNTGVETVTACDSYTWWNTNYTNSTNLPTHTFTNAAGCDSVVTLDLTVNYSTTGDTFAVACDSFTWRHTDFTDNTDNATHVMTNTAGCDSVVTLHLTINNSNTGIETVTACDSFTWHGINYTTAGTQLATMTNAAGCDSVVTLNLTINYSSTGDTFAVACDSFYWRGVTYFADMHEASPYMTLNSVGCDSVVTLHLTVNYSNTGVETVTACDSLTWHGINYTTAGTQLATMTNAAGCDSLVTLHLTVNYSNTGVEEVTACNSYVWHGTEYTASTNTPTYTGTNAAGCDSVTTLHLIVNHCSTTTITACDSYTWYGNDYNQSGTYYHGTDTLNLTLNYSNSGVEVVTACDSYVWHGTNYTASTNTPTFTETNIAGCDSVVTLNLTINYSTTGDTFVVACDSFYWHGTSYTTAGTQLATMTNAAGCDSVVTLHLTVNYSTTGDTTAVACDSFYWRGMTYYADMHEASPYMTINSVGCDSIVTLHLTVNHSTTGDTFAVACDSFTWHGISYTTAGTQLATMTNAAGCDSVVTLHLTMNYSNTGVETVTACDNYSWHGTNYTTSTNTPTFTETNAAGCDSVVTLNLTINYSTTGDTFVVACDSFYWHGTRYTTAGTQLATMTNAAGCDSVVTLNLTINYSSTGDTFAVACDSFYWRGVTYYVDMHEASPYMTLNSVGCDSLVTLHLTVNYSSTGDTFAVACDSFYWRGVTYYADIHEVSPYMILNSVGCDSVVTLHLTVNHSVTVYDSLTLASDDLPYNYYGNTVNNAGDYTFDGTTAEGCDSTTLLHVEVLEDIDLSGPLADLKVFPNPTRGTLTIDADDVVKVEVFDITGRKIATFEGVNTFDITNLSAGTYTLRIETTRGKTVRRIVKK